MFKSTIVITTVICVRFCSSEVLNYDTDCLNDTATFTCINEVDNFANIDIRSGSRTLYSVGFTSFDSIGRKYTRSLESSTIIGEVTATNSTYIATKLTIIGVNTLIGDTFVCNQMEERIKKSFNPNAVPTAVTLIFNQNNISITWNSPWMSYYIEVFTASYELLKNWTTHEPMIKLKLSNATQTVKIYVCPENHSEYTIGPCFFNKTNQNFLEKNYTVYTNGSWEVRCNETHLQVNRCYNDGTWEHDLCSNTDNKTDEVVNEQSLQVILISSVVPAGIILLIFAILITFIPSKLWLTRHKKKSSGENLPQTTNEAMTYEFLSNRHFNINNSRCNGQIHQMEMRECTDGNYSTLLHTKPSICTNDDYATIQSNISSKYRAKDSSQYDSATITSDLVPKQHITPLRHGKSLPKVNEMEYAEIKSCNHCGQIKPFVDHKVKYANICCDTHKADGCLNLDSLLIQLRSISDNFKLFGSVAGISPASLNEIVSKSRSSYDGLVEVCDLWLQKCWKEQTPPTWYAVAEILALIGQNKLSDDILQVYATGQLRIQVDMKSVATVTKLQDFSITLSTAPPLLPQRRENHEETTKIDLNETQSDEMSDDEVPPPVPPYYPEEFDPGKDGIDIPENLHANEVIPLDITSPVPLKELVHNSLKGTTAPLKHMEVATPTMISFGSQGIPETILKKNDVEKSSQTDKTMD